MVPKNRKKTKKTKKTGDPGRSDQTSKSQDENAQKAVASENKLSVTGMSSISGLPSSLADRSTFTSTQTEQMTGGISVPNIPVTSNSDSDIDIDYEEHSEEYEDQDDDEDDDEIRFTSAQWKAKSRARTRTFVSEFLDSTKHKHIIDMKIRPLDDKKDFEPWLFAIKTQLRIHQVWEVVENDLTMLASTDDLYPDLMRMKDIGCAVIFTSISQKVRECSCVFGSLDQRNPFMMMGAIHEHFGPNSDSTGCHSH
ncbi:hypothetical protein N7486_002341 [Penicillium sp. IBT 16267x]|nr:hypothetical protein N7486_002341 [Penicillium sp. IBT 16267x]